MTRAAFESRRAAILAGIQHTPDFMAAYWTARCDRDFCLRRLSDGARRRGNNVTWFECVSLELEMEETRP